MTSVLQLQHAVNIFVSKNKLQQCHQIPNSSAFAVLTLSYIAVSIRSAEVIAVAAVPLAAVAAAAAAARIAHIPPCLWHHTAIAMLYQNMHRDPCTAD
jgi:hypothetical protein